MKDKVLVLPAVHAALAAGAVTSPVKDVPLILVVVTLPTLKCAAASMQSPWPIPAVERVKPFPAPTTVIAPPLRLRILVPPLV